MSGAAASNPLPAPPAGWVRVLSAALKVAVIALIFAAAWWLINAYRGILPTRGPAPKSAPTAPPAEIDPTPGDWLLTAGGWSLGDTPWQVTRAALPAAELEQRMLSKGSPAPTTRAADPVEMQVIEWLKRAASQVKKKDGVAEYTLVMNRTRFRGVIESFASGDRLRLGQVTWPDEGNTWQLLELVPLPGEAGTANPLLPLPEGASMVARRWSDSRRVVAELVGPVTPDFDTTAGWVRAGWERTGSTGGPPMTERFARGGDVREVWRFVGPSGTGGQDFLLIFVPPNR